MEEKYKSHESEQAKENHRQYEIITSRQNAFVTQVGKLRDKKYRDADGAFLFDGIKLLEEALRAGVEIKAAVVKESSLKNLNPWLTKLTKQNVAVRVLADSVFSKVSEEKSPEGIICVAKCIDKIHKIATINRDGTFPTDEISHGERVFAVESVRNPGNLGTIIRSAAAFGVDCLLISSDCADIYNSKTVRASMGTLFRQKIVRTEYLAAALEALASEKRRTYAAALTSEALLLGKVPLQADDVIVVGNEGHGLSPSTLQACSHTLLIPMQLGTESLNAAVAASVCMWEQFGRRIASE